MTWGSIGARIPCCLRRGQKTTWRSKLLPSAVGSGDWSHVWSARPFTCWEKKLTRFNFLFLTQPKLNRWWAQRDLILMKLRKPASSRGYGSSLTIWWCIQTLLWIIFLSASIKYSSHKGRAHIKTRLSHYPQCATVACICLALWTKKPILTAVLITTGIWKSSSAWVKLWDGLNDYLNEMQISAVPATDRIRGVAFASEAYCLHPSLKEWLHPI